MAFVHHPEPKYASTERVGSRTVPFKDGRAQVTVPAVLRHYRDLGYQITDEQRRPNDAGQATPAPAPTVAPPVAEADGDDG